MYLDPRMQMTAKEVADLFGGSVEGDGEVVLRGLAKIEEACAGQLAFLSNAKYEDFAYTTAASALLVSRVFEPQRTISATLIRVPDVQMAFAGLMRMAGAANGEVAVGTHELAYVHPSADVHDTAVVMPFAYVGRNARVGARCLLHPYSYLGDGAVLGESCELHQGARLLRDCKAADRVVIYANAVVGSDGFGYSQDDTGSYEKIPQLGNVVLGDDVEIGACATVDRAVLGSTILRKGVKIDNLCMVAHNVVVGENTAFAAQVGVAGSARLGARIKLGGQVGVSGHITVADGTEVGAQSGIKDSVEEPNQKLFGSPATSFREWAALQAKLRRLPALEQRVKDLERRLDNN